MLQTCDLFCANCRSHHHQMHLKGSQYGEPSQMATSSWWHLRWADWPNILVKRCNLKSDFKTTLRCHGPLCLASGSSDAMPATIPMEAIPTELYHLSVGQWLQPAGFSVEQWCWAMKNPTQDTHIIKSICWSLVITNHHIIPDHTVALTALKLKHRVIQVLPVVLSACLCTYTRYMHRIQNIRIVDRI